MCTTSQNIYVPRDGIGLPDLRTDIDELAETLVAAIDHLLADRACAADVLRCIQSERIADRFDVAAIEGPVVLRVSAPIEMPGLPQARTRSPLQPDVDAGHRGLYMREMFRLITYLTCTQNMRRSLALPAESAGERGATTCAAYSTDEETIEGIEAAVCGARVSVSCNLIGPIWVDQAAAFSDGHVSGANPGANGTPCDAAFIASRYHVAQSRILVDD